MKKFLAAAAVMSLAFVSSAFAQHDYIAEVDTNGDGAIQRAEMDAMQGDHFNLQDADHDGALSATEARSGVAIDRAAYQAQALATFDGVDANHDSALTGDEITALRNLVMGARTASSGHSGH